MQINIGGAHQLEDAQPSHTPSDSAAPTAAAAAAADQEDDTQSSYSSDAQGEPVALPAGPTASNKKRKVVPAGAALASMDRDSDDGDEGDNEGDSAGVHRQGKCFLGGGGGGGAELRVTSVKHTFKTGKEPQGQCSVHKGSVCSTRPVCCRM